MEDCNNRDWVCTLIIYCMWKKTALPGTQSQVPIVIVKIKVHRKKIERNELDLNPTFSAIIYNERCPENQYRDNAAGMFGQLPRSIDRKNTYCQAEIGRL